MTTQNMKLLDLQTGKYLELDKDFWFGGNVIILFENLKRSTNTYSLLDEVNACARFIKQPHTDPIVNNIAGTVGAVVYGGRYVLLFSEQDTSIHDDNHCYKNGDVVRDGRRHGYVAICTASTHYSYHQNVLDIPNFQGSCEAGFLYSKYEILGNIFEEYSKQLRNEPNQFDELNQHFK